MREYDYVIVGAGLAAVSAVEGIRRYDQNGTILMLGEESDPPYNRPPLSKEYLQAPDIPRALLHVKPGDWYEGSGVTLEREQRVLSLDSKERTVVTARGNDYRGERILIATGGRARELPVPGCNLSGVHTLREAGDAEGIRSAAPAVDRVVLVGAGFVGMELAASLRRYGVDTVVVEQEDRVWPQLLPRELAAELRAYFEQRGVDFRLGASVTAFRGDGSLEAVELDDGSLLSCQLSVVGVGIVPNQEIAGAAGLAVKDGIVVDAFGETSHGFIYAAGDVARFPDPLFGDMTRVEHWDHARAHGRTVGANMAGQSTEYDHTSYFFSDVFDLGINTVGRIAETDEILVGGTLGDGPLIAVGSTSGVLVGILLVNAAAELEAARELMRRRPDLSELRAAFGQGSVDLGQLIE
jgi:3-phenylpropionate/trans-cinnamate dioxygenase ferredoxin reductase subunit